MSSTLPEDFVITTSRCRLRIPSESDIPHVFSASQHPGFNDGMVWDPPKAIEELQEPYLKSILSWQQGTSYSFSIEDIHSEEFIGRISIRKADSPGVWNIGFWTHPSQQGKGFMSEAANAVIRLGFETLRAERIEACHALWNAGSQRVLERIGMTFVKHIPEGFLKNGKWVPENLMAIDREAWASK